VAGVSVVGRTDGVVVVPARGVVRMLARAVMGVVAGTRLAGCFLEVLAALLEVMLVFLALHAHSGVHRSPITATR
jgi:hypothetical protein